MKKLPLGLDLIHKLTVSVIIVVLVCSLLSFAGTFVYLELVTHFRLQYLLISLACIPLLLASRSWKVLPLALCCAILNLLPTLPYYLAPPNAQVGTEGIRLKLLQANAFEKNRNYEALLNEVKRINPGVVVIQEFTEDWKTKTDSLKENYPNRLLEPRPSGSGMAIFSRYPFLAEERLVLDSSTHLALKVELSIEQASVTLLALHPTTPVTPSKFRNRNRQLAEAAAIMKATNGPKILVGDLNATMWSPYFQRLVRDSGLRDARLGYGVQPTWPVALPGFMRLPIDHCLVSNEWSVEGVSMSPDIGSDHKTILFELTLPKRFGSIPTVVTNRVENRER